jgi:MFS superfamily sulfate permease-like transporter
MLAGIGIIIILKQIPCFFLVMLNFEGDQSFMQSDGSNSFSSLFEVFNHIQLGSVVIIVSLIILIAWDKVPFKEINSSALIAVISGIVLNEILLCLVVLWQFQTHIWLRCRCLLLLMS